MSDYPKYQYSVFLKNKRDEQLVIRVDTWKEFKKAKENVNKILDKVEATESTDPDPEWIKETQVEESFPVCKIHDKEMTKGKYGWYCKTPTGEDSKGKTMWCKFKP